MIKYAAPQKFYNNPGNKPFHHPMKDKAAKKKLKQLKKDQDKVIEFPGIVSFALRLNLIMLKTSKKTPPSGV